MIESDNRMLGLNAKHSIRVKSIKKNKLLFSYYFLTKYIIYFAKINKRSNITLLANFNYFKSSFGTNRSSSSSL